ncbi:MAG: PadR family transcriptional regulator [Clostridiales bacterium]|nr:PadR family transcriptional regulator [Clostridiales bacterium]
MDAQTKRGLTEACVLKLLTRGDSYGYQLIKDMEQVMEMTESTLYPVLRRLENNGCLRVYSVEHNFRLRKYYAITDAGRDQIGTFLKEWEDVMRVYEFIREDDKHDEE